MATSSKISGWGRFPTVDAEVTDGSDVEAVRAALHNGAFAIRASGRSYGDSALGPRTLDVSHLSRFRAFDARTGVVAVEAGVTISDLLKVLGPQGWFPPVTPGTRFVSVGGAIASDVHGKNHHVAGSFSDHVLSFELMLGSGEVLTVSRESYPDLFHATCGGMGLTGVILAATVQMLAVNSNSILETTFKLPDLVATVDALEAQSASTYSVAWVDCTARRTRLGRSLLMVGEHADDGLCENRIPEKSLLTVPVELPAIALNALVVRVFNNVYYSRVRQPVTEHLRPYTSFFYPLDAITEWNRLYGRRGFLQYQFVTPLDAGLAPLRQALEMIADSGMGSPLAVLKTFGEGNDNPLSFPMRGYTLALDFPAKRKAFELLDRLDPLITGHGGRIYMTKDARMSADTFRSSYPRWEEFEAVRERYGAHRHFQTLQSERLGLE